MNIKIAKSTVRSLYGDFPEFPQLPNSTLGRPIFGEMSILKCVCNISDVGLCKPPGNGDIANQPALDLQSESGEFGWSGNSTRLFGV